MKALRGFRCLTISAFCAVAPLPAWSQSVATPAPSASPMAENQPPVEELSARRAQAERGKIYRAGVAYSHWIDGLAKKSASPFLQRRVFDRVTWMRLLA
jgi:CubicO group peptidase (beta-lactamase class C family)